VKLDNESANFNIKIIGEMIVIKPSKDSFNIPAKNKNPAEVLGNI